MSLPINATLAPEFRNLKATALPTPEEAPVTKILFLANVVGS